MQKYFFASAILVFLTMTVLGAKKVQPHKPIPWKAGTMTIRGHVSGTNYLTLIEITDVTNAPVWKVNDDNPPVSLPKAEHLAADALAKAVGGSDEWRAGTVTLHEYDPRPCGGGYWIYEISFEGPAYISPVNHSKVPSSVTVCVMMNGKVICPQPWP